MVSILPDSDNFGQELPSLDKFDPTSLEKFDKDYVYKLVYDDVVVKSGVLPEICRLNFDPASGTVAYEQVYGDSDKTTNSGGSIEATRNLARCNGSPGYFLGKNFYTLSDLAGDTKAARYGTIKSKGIFRPEGPPAYGWIGNNRFRQLGGAPIALDLKKSTGVWEPRRYHQPKGKPLEIFFLRVTVRVWKLVAEKAGLSMPEFPVVGVDGEAIGFWEWVKDTKCPIVITEGEKKAAALISRGFAAIGLPGINTGYRVTERGERITIPDGTTYQRAIARELDAALQPFDTADREITIIFDFRAGDYRQSSEFRAASTTARLLKSAIAKIAILPGPDKGVDDFCVAGGDIAAVLADAKDYRKLAIENQWRRDRQYTPDRTINSRYFHALAPAVGTIMAINSGLATGKTQFLKDVIASNPEGKIIVLGSRNGLLLQTAEKCGFYHLNAHNGYQMFKNPDARLCLCFDSLLKLPPEIFEGATIILDEAESVLRHLLMSPTLKRDREAIKARFSAACGDASRIILLDGHLTDYTVGLVAKLVGNKTVTKHLNEFKGNCPKVSIYETEKATPTAAEKQDFINKILASDCPAIATDCSVAEAEALADALTEAKGPGLLICSKNSNEPDQTEFQTNPDAWTEKDNPAWLLYTPTLENGLDISKCGKFTDVFGLFCGLLGVNSQIQMLRRVRHPLNQISVLCPKRGLSDNPDRRSYYSSQIKLQIEASINIESALLCPADYQEAIREEINRQFADPLFVAYCHFEAQENLEKSELRAFLIEALRDGGYEVDEPIIGGDESGDHADKKIACKEKEAQEIFNSPDISLEEAQEISRSNKARWPERCQAEKCYLKARLPGIEDTKLWGWEFIDRIRSKDRSLLNQLENSWLFHNPDDAEYLQKSKWESGKFESFLPDHSPQWLKLKALHKLQISQFLNPDTCWDNESPEIKSLLRDGGRSDARKILGEPGKNGIKYLNRLLGLIGIKLVHKQARGEGGKRIHEYRYQPQPTTRLSRRGPLRICSLPEDWPELAELTSARMAQKIEAKKASVKSAETVAPSSLDAVTDSSDFININLESSVTEITPENTTAEGAADTLSKVAIDGEAEAEPEPTGKMGWVSRWGKWVRAAFLGPTDGCQLRILIEEVTGWNEVRAFPDQLRWDGGASC